MRILKRNLAFVLTIAIALGLMVSASAAGVQNYKDANSITYVEAVDTLTALGILEGENGVFNPTNILTREQAAKIIAYLMLGKKAADSLTTAVAPFNDVPATRWSAGYVAYCATKGIIGGYGNGNFGPADQLTGTQFAKMLLCAIGYNQQNEFTGPNWESNVNSLALKLGVFEGNEDVVLSAGCKREEAALYAFNVLTDIMTVKFSRDAQEYYSGAVFNSLRESQFEYTETLGYKLYSLRSRPDTDAFGRASRFWAQRNTKLTDSYHDEADATYVKQVNSGTIYSDLGLSKTNMAEVYRNGVKQPDFQLKRGLTSAKLGGNGVLVEAYVDEYENVTIIIIDTYLAKVEADAADGEVDVTVYAPSSVTKMTYETNVDYAKGDWVLVTVADNEIQSMDLAEKELGKLQTVGFNYIRLDGTKYTNAANLVKDADTFVADYDSEMAALLDENGYLYGLVVEEEEAKNDGYVYVKRDEGRSSSLLDTRAAVVEVLYLDGTGVEVLALPTRVKNNQTQYRINTADGKAEWKPVTGGANNLGVHGKFYAYRVNDDGEIILTQLNSDKARAVYNDTVVFEKKQTGTFGSVTSFLLNGNTKLTTVGMDDGKVKTSTGYKNININEASKTALAVYDGRLVKNLYVLDGTIKEDDIYAYFSGTTYQTSNGTFVTLYVNGEPVDYKFSDSALTNAAVKAQMPVGAYTIVVKNDNELESYNTVALESTKVTVTAARELYFEAAGARNYYSDSVKIYDVTDDGLESNVARNDVVVFRVKDGVVTHVWIVDQVSKEVTPDPVPSALSVTFDKPATPANVINVNVANLGSNSLKAFVYNATTNAELGSFDLVSGTNVYTYTGTENATVRVEVKNVATNEVVATSANYVVTPV